MRIAPDDVAAILANEAVHPARQPGRMSLGTSARLLTVTEHLHSSRRARHAPRCGIAPAAAFVVAFAACDAIASGTALEEVVVTATRRPEPVLDVPLSIGRVGPDTIQLVDATHHVEVLNRVAGVMIQRGSGPGTPTPKT
jgi:outer membrane receptor protein involved in Fe transport